MPRGRQWRALAIVAGGCVLGFPLLSALALQHISATRSLVFTGLLPLSTASFAVLRGKERPSPRSGPLPHWARRRWPDLPWRAAAAARWPAMR
ncbi:EamA family transporter [Novosphingobium pokkalii]|uniref:EamA family transporter n=1 Tax=Novosphingobium pokkalii TaxID=1770194 RepID=UPI00363228B2